MTVVCAVRDGNVILMSADTAATADSGYSVQRRDSKLFRLRVPVAGREHDMLVGFCGDYQRFQLMACAFKPPPMRLGQDAWHYMVSVFVPALRKFFGARFAYKEEKSDSFMGSEEVTLLIAFQQRMFSVYCNGQVEESAHPFASIGVSEAALGALHALHACDAHLESWEKLDAAMRASAAFSSTVRAPFHTQVLFDGPHRQSGM